MAIYPKKKIRKYYRGGQLPPGAVDLPVVGIGLQYRPTSAAIPNLDTLRYLDESLRASDAKMEQERQKRMLDRNAFREQISKIQGTPGAQGRLWNDFNAIADNLDDRLREDINFAFSPENAEMMSQIQDVFNPQRLQRMQANIADLTTQYETSLKNGTQNQYHVVGDMASVVDRNGNIKRVHVSQLVPGEAADQFRPMTNKEHYEAAMNHPDYDISNTDLVYYGSNLKNTDEILKEWSAKFNQLGHAGASDGITSVMSNSSQINAIKKALKEGMSSQDRDAMLGLFLSKNNGVFDKTAYNQWLNRTIDDVAAGKFIYEEETKLPTPIDPKNPGGNESPEDGLGMPMLARETGLVAGERDTMIGPASSIGVLTSGRSTYKTPSAQMIQLSGNTYKLSDEAGWTTENNQVSPSNKHSRAVYGVAEYYVMPEFTGEVVQIKDGKQTRKTDSNFSKGKLVAPEFTSETVKDGVQTDRDNKGHQYKYVAVSRGDEDGEVRAVVNEYGRRVVSELDENGQPTGHKYIADLNYEDSFRYLQGDFARIKDMSKVAFNNSAITDAGRKTIASYAQQYALSTAELSKAIQKISARDPRRAELVAEYNKQRVITSILQSFLNGQEPLVNLDEGVTPEMIQAVRERYINGLQELMDEAYYKEVQKNTILPKPSFTLNTGNIQGN